jgi:NADH:ubiquinone oxidoreductase subunit E
VGHKAAAVIPLLDLAQRQYGKMKHCSVQLNLGHKAAAVIPLLDLAQRQYGKMKHCSVYLNLMQWIYVMSF